MLLRPSHICWFFYVTLCLVVSLAHSVPTYAYPEHGFNTDRDGKRFGARRSSHVDNKGASYHSKKKQNSASIIVSKKNGSQALNSAPSLRSETHTESLALHSFAAQMLAKKKRETSDLSAKSSSLRMQTLNSKAPISQASRTNLQEEPQEIEEKKLPDVEQAKLERVLSDASRQSAAQIFGKSVCVAITGVDSRIGVAQRHADANHVMRIWLESGRIEIFSIPRGTKVDAGFKTDALNYLANLRSNKGREIYLRKLADIAGVPKIDYWVEFGFSQSIGLIELLGFKDKAASTLHVLRTRKAYAVGDYQRCYNQGQFIRQMVLNNFNKSTGFLGNVALRGALGLVETNISFDVARSIIDELAAHRFPSGSEAVSVRLRPPFKAKLKELDLSDVKAITQLNATLNGKLAKSGYIGKSKAPAFDASKYERALVAKIQRAERARGKASVAAVQQVYKQRSWLQIRDESKRNDYMRRVCDALSKGYEDQGFILQADDIRYFYEQQTKGLNNSLGVTK